MDTGVLIIAGVFVVALIAAFTVLKNGNEEAEVNEPTLDPMTGEELMDDSEEIEITTRDGSRTVRLEVSAQTARDYRQNPKATLRRLRSMSNRGGRYRVHRSDEGEWDLLDYYLFYQLFLDDDSEYDWDDSEEVYGEDTVEDTSESVEDTGLDAGDVAAGVVAGEMLSEEEDSTEVEDSVDEALESVDTPSADEVLESVDDGGSGEDALGDFAEESSSSSDDTSVDSGDQS